ncbi:MAG TPA: RNA methyltransferase [Geobacteraceae bacterium]|nr:RNA methyltransferase [Geobacteraceae bacterium]
MAENVPTGPNLSIALLHYPVYDKNRNLVTTAVTNLDVHDIARSAKTYGVYRYYVLTPLKEQQELALSIINHWQKGYGASYNPKRKEALDLVTVAERLEFAVEELEKEFGRPVRVVATGASGSQANISYGDMARLLEDRNQTNLLLFGTGWGLADEVLARAHFVLEPIKGYGSYNHLSVRSAAAIILDRLLGRF